MRVERDKILKDNEEHIEEQEKKQKGEDNSDEDDDGFVDEDGSDDEDDGETEAGIMSKIGKIVDEGGVDDDDDDDDDDSDYEYTGGDLAIYDSALDDVDELIFVKEALERLNAADAGYTAHLLSGADPERLAKFNENMQTAQSLREREEVVRKRCDELDEGREKARSKDDDLF